MISLLDFHSLCIGPFFYSSVHCLSAGENRIRRNGNGHSAAEAIKILLLDHKK